MAPKLDNRAALIKSATTALYGARGQTKMAASIGISKQMLSFILTGQKPVTDDVVRKVAVAIHRETERMRSTAKKLDRVAGLILLYLEG